jgi:hypothetical protein
MAFASSRARRGRRLLVATAGVAAVSYSGCFLDGGNGPVGNLMAPNCDATPNSDWCANYTDSGSDARSDASDATAQADAQDGSDDASDAAGDTAAAADGAPADAASD